MMKRVAAEHTAAMNLHIERLRKKGLRSMRGKIIPETLRESHAREFAVRSWIVPSFRSSIGPGLKAIILPGSVQLGIRKASKKRQGSDIDVSIIVSSLCIPKSMELARAAQDELKSMLGVEVNIHVFPPEIFEFNETHLVTHSAFQVLYGRQWLEKTFGKRFDQNFLILRQIDAFGKSKYALQEKTKSDSEKNG